MRPGLALARRAMILLATLLACAGGAGAAWAQVTRSMTLTELSFQEQGASAETGDLAGLLWVQNQPARDVYLRFMLGRLPSGLARSDLLRCTLRVVAQNVSYLARGNRETGAPLVLLKGAPARDDLQPKAGARDVVALSTLSSGARMNRVASGTGDELCNVIHDAYQARTPLSLRLHTDTRKASTLLYGAANPGGEPSNLPRLVIEYRQPPADLLESASWAQMQQNPEHTGRSPLQPARSPAGFTLTKVPLPRIDGAAPEIVDYPLIHRGTMYVVVRTSARNVLLALDARGGELWRAGLASGTVQRPPVISRTGRLYLFLETQFVTYDLTERGAGGGGSLIEGTLANGTDLTISNDGSLYVVLTEQGTQRVHGFDASHRRFLRSVDLASGPGQVSTVTVSPDGRKLHAMTSSGALVIDVANPSDQLVIAPVDKQDAPLERLRTPVAGPRGVVVHGDFGDLANSGHLRAVDGKEQIWWEGGGAPTQAVLASDGRLVYLRGGKLLTRAPDTDGAATVLSVLADLAVTSNVVMDGAGNVYFWNGGVLRGHGKDGAALFTPISFVDNPQGADGQKVQGAERNLRLMLGPDGTIWANNVNGDSLYAFSPTYAPVDPTRPDDLPLVPDTMKSEHVYRATGKVQVGAGTIAKGNMLIQGRQGVSFTGPLRVELGAGLLVRTGF